MHMHAHAHAQAQAHAHARTHAYTHLRVHTHLRAHTHTHTHNICTQNTQTPGSGAVCGLERAAQGADAGERMFAGPSNRLPASYPSIAALLQTHNRERQTDGQTDTDTDADTDKL